MKPKYIFSIIVIIIFSLISFYLNNIIWILSFLVSIWFYTIIFYFFHILWRRIRKKEIIESSIYIKTFLYRVSLLLIIWTIIFWGLSYLSNEVYPAKMSEYTISNWKKTIKFQSMIHIWTHDFYNEIKNNIENFKNNWWVYFFEWVKPWNEENMVKFNQALWIEFDENLYKNFSKLYWVTFQDNSIFLWLVNNLDFNVDLNIDQIMKLYDKKIENKTDKSVKAPLKANDKILEILSNLNEKELKILVYINQAILNLIIWSEDIQTSLSQNFGNKELFEVILEERNKVIVSEIINSKYDNIYITYWSLHLKWVIKLLKEDDSNWEIIKVKNLYPIK